jgi:hypothetical protein
MHFVILNAPSKGFNYAYFTTNIRVLLAVCFMLVSCLAYSSTLKREVICSSETPVDFQRTTWRYIPKVRTLLNHGLETSNPTSLENNPQGSGPSTGNLLPTTERIQNNLEIYNKEQYFSKYTKNCVYKNKYAHGVESLKLAEPVKISTALNEARRFITC